MTFKDVIKMFDNLISKGYKVQEIVNMPVEVGDYAKEK